MNIRGIRAAKQVAGARFAPPGFSMAHLGNMSKSRPIPPPSGNAPQKTKRAAATGCPLLSRNLPRPSALRLLVRLLLPVHMRELFADARGLSGTVAEVVELGATHVALALHLDARDERRVHLERALDA